MTDRYPGRGRNATGHCTWDRHHACRYGTPLPLHDGSTYTCTCDCHPGSAPDERNPTMTDTAPLVIVGCGSAKRSTGRWPAEQLYTGGYFKARLAYARTLTPDSNIMILSAHYGLVGLGVTLDPYDLRLGQPGSVTADRLRNCLATGHAIAGEPDWLNWPVPPVVLAGADYVALAAQVWPDVVAPLAGVGGIGDQLAWLKLHTEEQTERNTIMKTQLTDDRTVDERKLLLLPVGAERPTAKLLGQLMRDVGYTVKARDTRAQLLTTVADGTYKQRQALSVAIRTALGIDLDAPAKGLPAPSSNGKAKKQAAPMTVADMRDRIRRKGYTGTVPQARDEVEAMYQSLVGEKRIPHTYPTGTRLIDEVDKPFTSLRVTPEPHQPLRTVTLSAKNRQGERIALEAIAEKANRRGLLVDIGPATHLGDDVYEAEVTLVPADPTDDDQTL